jgi:hypothetical protein
MNKKNKKETESTEEDKKFPLPVYDDKDDIYSKEKEEPFDEGDTPKKKGKKLPGEDLDVPGSELDDADESVGEEDEENNYYSLGGDDHNDLEEDPDQ